MYEAEPTTTHASMASPWLSGSAFVSSLNAVHDRGYVIIENVMSPEDCRQYRDELEHHMAQSPRGRNVFEGTSSHRLYALLAKSERFAAMVEHPLALAFAGRKIGTALAFVVAANIVVYEIYEIKNILLPWALVAIAVILVLKLVSFIAEKAVLFGTDINDEILTQRNTAAGALRAIIYISVALLLAEI